MTPFETTFTIQGISFKDAPPHLKIFIDEFDLWEFEKNIFFTHEGTFGSGDCIYENYKMNYTPGTYLSIFKNFEFMGLYSKYFKFEYIEGIVGLQFSLENLKGFRSMKDLITDLKITREVFSARQRELINRFEKLYTENFEAHGFPVPSGLRFNKEFGF